MRIRTGKAHQQGEQPIVRYARRMPKPGAVVPGSAPELRADDEIGSLLLELQQGLLVKVRVAEIYFVADDEFSASALDAVPERQSVVGCAQRHRAQPREFG